MIQVFIYNKIDFDNLYVKIDHTQIVFNNLPTGSSTLTGIYTAPYTVATGKLFYGICGF
jgi:hypothetical protein